MEVAVFSLTKPNLTIAAIDVTVFEKLVTFQLLLNFGMIP